MSFVWVLMVMGQVMSGPFTSPEMCEAYRIQSGLALNPYASCVMQRE